jgi:hypothetical protein
MHNLPNTTLAFVFLEKIFFGCGVLHSSRCAKVTIQVNNSTARALPQKRKRTISTEKKN